MTVGEFIRDLQAYPLDMLIEIECPNGLLVEPQVKYVRETPFVYNSAIKSLVLTGRY